MTWGEVSTNDCIGASGDTIHSHPNKAVLDSVGQMNEEQVLCGDGIWRQVSELATIPATAAIQEVREAGEDITRGSAVVVINNLLYLADNTDWRHLSAPKSIAKEDTVKGELVAIQKIGAFAMVGWGLTPNATYFISKKGEITKDIPTTGFLQKIGNALTDDSLVLNGGVPIKM